MKARRLASALTIALAVLVIVLSGAVAVLVVRSIDQANGLSKRPNCALVDDAIRKHRVPDPAIVGLCRASARGLVYSLRPEDLEALRQR